MSDGWIIVPNWDRFQHYRDREPIWIKLYLELRDRDDWGDLSWAQRGLLVSVWMEFGASRGVLRASSLSQRCRQKTRKDTLDSLVSAGFIRIVASKPLALARSREVEEELKENKRLRSHAKPKVVENQPYEPRTNVVAKDPFKAITAMIRNGAIQNRVDLDAEIAGARLNGTKADELRGMLPR